MRHRDRIRLFASHLVVSCEGPRRAKFVEHYSRRDGVRAGGGQAQLINTDIDEPASRDRLRRRRKQIDVLYRTWSRRRSDVEALRDLQDAISDYIGGASSH